MESSEAARKVLDFIREKLLFPLATPWFLLTPTVLWRWRHELHVLHHFASASLGETVSSHTGNLLRTSAGLWRLLSDNESTLSEIRDYEWARGLSAASDLAGISEELLSGEDRTLRDVLFDAMMFFLNWKSNTYWVDAGKKSHRVMARSYLLEIQEELWELLRESTNPTELTLERARGLGALLNELLNRLGKEEIPPLVQVALLTFLYQWILRLQMGRLLVRMEEMSSGES